MNRFMRKVTVLTLALIMAATAAVFAQYTPEKDFRTKVAFDQVIITEYIGKDSVVKIPPTIGGLPVVGVGGHKHTIMSAVSGSGFRYNKTITSVTIPDTVETIWDEAFMGCTALESVTIGKGVWEIGYGAFWGCSALKSITIPAGVGEIGPNAFQACTSLSTVTFLREAKGEGGGTAFPGTRLDSVNSSSRGKTSMTFAGTPGNLVIFVPKNSVDAYKKEGKWYAYRDKILAIGAPRPTPKVVESVSTEPSTLAADQRDGELNPGLVGTWKRNDSTLTYTFNADGTGTSIGSKSTDSLTWITESGNRLTITLIKANSTLTYTYVKSGNRLTLTLFGKSQVFAQQ